MSIKSEKSFCNMCGKILYVFDSRNTEDFLKVRKEWGYFSEKDGIVHSFCLCEKCYDKLVSDFRIPVTETELTEF